MSSQLFATKNIQTEIDASSNLLARTLDAKHLVLLGIGAIIGAGIFVMTGKAAADYAGPAIILSFVLAGTACVFAGLCYAEFAAMIPVSGSAYSYAYATLGELVAWFIGWALVLEYLFAASAVAVGWSGYFQSLIANVGLHFPAELATAPFSWANNKATATGGIINLPAVIIVSLISGLCYVGMKQSAWVNAVVVAIKLVVIALFVGFSISYIDPANWVPFVPEVVIGPDGSEKFGWDGVFRAASIIFFAYIGFDAVSTAAQEAKNPQRDMPIGILGSLIICTVIYIIVSAVLTGMAHYTTLGTDKPVATALEAIAALTWLKVVVEVGAIAGLSSVILVMLMGQPRIFFAMSNDGLMPKMFGAVHPKFQTPYKGTIIVGLVAGFLAGFFPLGLLGDLVSMGTLLAFTTVCAGVLILRHTRPEIVRPFRVPMPWLICPLGILFCGFLLSTMGLANWMLLAGWTAVGMLIYAGYGYRNSRLRQQA